jgi:hypothetical protein
LVLAISMASFIVTFVIYIYISSFTLIYTKTLQKQSRNRGL